MVNQCALHVPLFRHFTQAHEFKNVRFLDCLLYQLRLRSRQSAGEVSGRFSPGRNFDEARAQSNCVLCSICAAAFQLLFM